MLSLLRYDRINGLCVDIYHDAKKDRYQIRSYGAISNLSCSKKMIEVDVIGRIPKAEFKKQLEEWRNKYD